VAGISRLPTRWPAVRSDGALVLERTIRDVALPRSPACTGADVVVVIPTLNEARHIETCIRSLMQGDHRMRAVEMIVADGGSTDGTQGIVLNLRAEYPGLRLLNNWKKLQSAAVNMGARDAGIGRRILVRCDAHAIYPAGYVMQVADSLARRKAASVVVPMDAAGMTYFQKANAWIVDTPLGSGGSAHRGGRRSGFVDHGHHAGFDLQTFLHVGGYDETFSHNEDAEFDTRLRQAGGRIFLDADIRLTYLPRATMRSLARQYFNYGKGRARTILKHGEPMRLRQMIPPATLLACGVGLLGAVVTPWALLLPGGYLAALAAASVMIAVKHRSLCGLWAGAASATMHMSWSLGLIAQMLKRRA
jgi:succinoglycan biosynthesis protein ExoA